MKNLIWLILMLAGCSVKQNEITEKLSLSGEWNFKIDSLDQGIENKMRRKRLLK